MLRSLALLGIMLFVAGCHSASEPTRVAAAPEATPAAPAAAAANEPKSNTPTPADTAAQAAAKTAVAAHFEPPFPNRADLFEPPRGSQSNVRRDEEHGETVELKGFVDVNGPQVILAIDGVLSPIPEGGEKYGVQVISIHPPSVVLQRGRSRWTATLE